MHERSTSAVKYSICSGITDDDYDDYECCSLSNIA